MLLEPGVQVVGNACVEMRSCEALQDVDILPEESASAKLRRDNVRQRRTLVEAAGVEPASEIDDSRETPCSVQFRKGSLRALRTDKIRQKLVR